MAETPRTPNPTHRKSEPHKPANSHTHEVAPDSGTDAPNSSDYARIERIRAVLTALNYTYDGVRKLLGERAFEAMARDQIVPGAWRLRSILEDAHTPASRRNLARITGLFLFAHTLTEHELAQALGGRQALADYAAAHLIEPAPENPPAAADSAHPRIWRAAVDMRPYLADNGTELWVTSDMGAHARPGVLRTDHVLGVGQASLTLAQIIERTPVARALDLGTGCGIQTFHLLAHAQHVSATDISVRALAFTRFNLLLNAPALSLNPHNLEERVSLLHGSLLEPVKGQKFDLVVSNPPFVITPRRTNESSTDRFTYRDGGLSGDAIVSTLMREIPGVLNPGGRAQMLGNWEIPTHPVCTAEPGGTEEPGSTAPQPWDERPRSWVNQAVGGPAEAWLIQREVLTPESYAETWLKDASENRDRAHYERTYTAYLEDFAQRNVHSIGFGMIWLRRLTTEPPAAGAHKPLLQRFEQITHPIAQPIAATITHDIARYDRLRTLTDTALAAEHLVVADDVTEERHGSPGAEHPGVILLRAASGLCRTVLLSTETAGFVSACDGQLSVGQIADALAALLGWEQHPSETQATEHAEGTTSENAATHPRDTLFSAVRELIEKGFLRFANEPEKHPAPVSTA